MSARGVTGRLERTIDRHFLLRIESPVPGFLSLFSFGADDGTVMHLQGYLFSDGAPSYVADEQAAWQSWLEGVASELAPTRPV